MSQKEQNLIENSTHCKEIEDILTNNFYFILMPLQMILLIFILISIIILIIYFKYNKFYLHGNLLILFTNIIILYFIHSTFLLFSFIRYKILLYTYNNNSCNLLTPIWLVLTIYAPYYINSIAYPLFHFCIMIERIRATILAEKYENENYKLGILMCILIWLISIIYYIYLALSALADTDNFGQPQGPTYITSKYNATTMFYMTIITLILMIVTTLGDWRITILNKKIRMLSKNSIKYNLSHNFQLNENIISMRLIFPLDLSYAIFYSFYIIIVLILRAYKSSMSLTQYVLLYDAVDTFIFLHTSITIIKY
ncbi:hypothetical protein Mgra_00005351 [Meloidogyne graminicola]|uniref:Uncharacterized protein n=1 Tax=Meloidogyne graminicola TaxID=189291 RepID=A0A8S9ZQ95_9BILA|nr:hypothetical protein Mgra_00005351 [Meloidogyne graminicola]